MHRKFFYDSNQITNTDSATLVLAMRQACKNILYTVANSGNYTVEDPNAGGMSNMTKMFIIVDTVLLLVSLGILAIVFVRYRRKGKIMVDEKNI
jgi:beta-glucosidase